MEEGKEQIGRENGRFTQREYMERGEKLRKGGWAEGKRKEGEAREREVTGGKNIMKTNDWVRTRGKRSEGTGEVKERKEWEE